MAGDTIKAALLKEAERLFALKGFENVSIREIARAAHANSSMIFYYFTNKQGLYNAVIESKMAVMRAILAPERVEQKEPEEILADYARTIGRLHAESPYFTKIFCREIRQPSDVRLIGGFIDSVRKVLLQALADGVAAGRFRRDMEPWQTLLMLVGSLDFYFCAQPLLSLAAKGGEKDAAAFVENTLAVFLRGISEVQ